MIQTELEEASFDISSLKRFLMQNSGKSEQMLHDELERWNQNYVDVNNLVKKLLDAERANRKLREEVSRLREKAKSFDADRQRSLNTVDRLRECCDHLQSEIDKRQQQKSDQQKPQKSPRAINVTSRETSTGGQNVGLKKKSAASQTTIDRRSNDDVAVYDYEDDDEDDVLFLLPSSISETDLHVVKSVGKSKGKESAKLINGGVSISDDAGSLVTVLATDGYTCITSPVAMRQQESPQAEPVSTNRNRKNGNPVLTGYSGDSGLSSDSSDQSAGSPANNRSSSMTTQSNFSDDSSDNAKSSDSKERLEDDLEAMYAERNVLQEEALTVETEQISIDRFRQRFVGSTSNSDIGAVVDLDSAKSKRKTSGGSNAKVGLHGSSKRNLD